MKTNDARLKSVSTATTLVLLMLVVPLAAFGQAEPKRPRGPGGLGAAFGPGGGGRAGAGYQRLLSVLTEEQKASLREAMDEHREKVRELEEKLRVASRELYAAGLSGNFDEDRVHEKAATVAKLEA